MPSKGTSEHGAGAEGHGMAGGQGRPKGRAQEGHAEVHLGLAGRLAKGFLRSKLTPLIVLASLMLGMLAVWLTPREEEPQIIVPMVDLYVPFPGASPKEVESQVARSEERRVGKGVDRGG